MKYLVTGGAGFIGSHLIDRLLSDGHSVICIDNFDNFYDPSIKWQNIKYALKNKNFKLIQGDIRDKSILKSCFKKNEIDIVIHLAARAGVRPSIEQPELYYDVNVIGTLRLLETMREFNIKKMIFASSSSVYGNNKKVPFSETDNVNFPISPYAATKKAGELLCYTYHHLYNFDVFCLRLFTVYGPRQRPEMAIHLFTRNLLEDKPIKMFGDGSSKRDYTFIDDIIDGIIASLETLKGYEIINLGESKTISLANLISIIEKITSKNACIEKLSVQPGDVLITYADISKAKNLLGYNPNISIEQGIRQFVDWINNKNESAFCL